jgi:hypothetical protein
VIRPMTHLEIRKALRRAAEVCIEKGRICWHAIDVCMADATAEAANDLADEAEFADTPEHAAFFLLLVAATIKKEKT